MALSGCSYTPIDNDSPADVQMAEGERLLSKGRYVEAVERFRILRTRHPHSKQAALASLRIGDAHYEEEAFIEAASAYKLFRELHPKHERAPYALFRLGESYYQQIPSTADRDLSAAQDAIEAYAALVEKFPQSQDAATARERIHTLRQKLAEKEDYIGDFYFKRDLFRAAASRYQNLMDQFAGFGFDERALYRLASALEKIGEHVRAEEMIDRYRAMFPEGKFLKNLEDIRKRLAEKN
ncbi:MAG: outer membrane protein assembly factor BamD [Bdellovibrionales bacterium]|nr:outer membrane protein assembly factor BamD [Bdellovibrionales bacterium]